MQTAQSEKKVEYIELIYDLIFVYIIGRNNDLLHVMKGAFIDPSAFLAYIITALIMLQIWCSTALFINRYGENDRPMHAGIFVSMYLLYFMARGIRADWAAYYGQFCVAWALILGNLALQYGLQLRRTEGREPEGQQIRMNLRTLLIQIAVILLSIPMYHRTGLALAPLAMVYGVAAAIAGRKANLMLPVAFGHLTERAMLYVVFTFGEMIICITGYFDGAFGWHTIHFSVCAFLIIAGLFAAYGLFYDCLLDRERTTNGTLFLLLHVPLILSLNHITAAMEFMRDDAVAHLPKNVFLVLNFSLFYLMFWRLLRYSKPAYRLTRVMNVKLMAGLCIFILLMLLTWQNGAVSIAVTVLFIGYVYLALRRFYRRRSRDI